MAVRSIIKGTVNAKGPGLVRWTADVDCKPGYVLFSCLSRLVISTYPFPTWLFCVGWIFILSYYSTDGDIRILFKMYS
jgi:hypothetical protein